jgi:hypothetical protein
MGYHPNILQCKIHPAHSLKNAGYARMIDDALVFMERAVYHMKKRW